MRILYSERCRCAKPRPWGMMYLGRDTCRECRQFLPLDVGEAAQLAAAEWEAEANRLKRATLTVDQVRKVLHRAIKENPTRSGTQLRDEVAWHGFFEASPARWYAIINDVRADLGLSPRRGNARGLDSNEVVLLAASYIRDNPDATAPVVWKYIRTQGHPSMSEASFKGRYCTLARQMAGVSGTSGRRWDAA